MPKALHIHATDNVAVCTSAVKAGDEVDILEPDGSSFKLTAKTAIPFCNKIALKDVAQGENILKYGESIGKAMVKIEKGSLANHDNIQSQPRSYAEEYVLGKEGK